VGAWKEMADIDRSEMAMPMKRIPKKPVLKK